MFKNIQMLIGIGAVMTGCALEDEALLSSVGLEADVEDTCNSLVCPGNSNLLGLLGPYELDETGVQLSKRGFRIIGMEHEGEQVTTLRVKGTSLEATKRSGVTLTGSDLKGLKLTLEKRIWGQHTGEVFDLSIEEHMLAPYYTGVTKEIHGFKLTYGHAGVWTDICPYSTDELGIIGSWAVFWKGDRFHPYSGKIFASDGDVGSWFNISCGGEAPIKMLRARTGGAVAPQSPVAQRQATLYMFTASYCGPTGDRYTELGRYLDWSDRSGPQQIGNVITTEAIWNENGAVCLNTPRMVDRNDVRCSLDPCSPAMIANWSQNGWWLLSGNPL